ncbi:GlxA family transcriptional regulator [Vibrio paucivorans]|uniref:Helix-turn-helix domain-containing protein n=1 Tax=Vibrio paucivorans TaxID=2829489 RepID=A0A9X3CH37_9VIBR|nr:AraC family transcriptional regulator [Vibrio paucivorans]MCW8335646.1 helix-turn-helix domain-containing protein [Vibrio paucivorans]
MDTPKTYKVALVAFEGISAFHLSVPCLVFQDVFIDRHALFELEICSLSQYDISSASGFDIVVQHDIQIIDNSDIIIIPSWPNALPDVPTNLIEKLLAAHQRGVIIVGLCLGAFVLAHTGLLNGKTATTHWAFSKQFEQRFPNVIFDNQPLFIDHGLLITSAGTAAALDCCLHIVRKLCGSEVASELARVMVTAPFRAGGQQQYIPTPISPRPENPTSFTQVIEQVESQINQQHNIDTLAERCAMSRRTFTRQFKANYGCTFGQWLMNQRLQLSQRLLESSQYPISQVAELSGFGSESVYRKHFKAAFQLSPSQWRANFSG